MDANTNRDVPTGHSGHVAGSRRVAVCLGLVGLLVASALVLASCTNAPTWRASRSTALAAGACPAADNAASDLTRAEVGDAVLCIVNRLRATRGLGALRTSSKLTRVAALHSADMVASAEFSHTGSQGETLRRRVVRAGYVSRAERVTLGETIGWGSGSYATAAELVDAFMQSSEHRRILLAKRFRDVGVGVQQGAPAPGVGDAAATITIDVGRR